MIQKIKKPVSILLSLVMVISLFTIVPITASAEVAPDEYANIGDTFDDTEIQFEFYAVTLKGGTYKYNDEVVTNDITFGDIGASSGADGAYIAADGSFVHGDDVYYPVDKNGDASTWYVIGGSLYGDDGNYYLVLGGYDPTEATTEPTTETPTEAPTEPTTEAPTETNPQAGDFLPESDYLTFTAVEPGSSVSMNVNAGTNWQYNKNNSGWVSYDPGTEIALENEGDSVSFSAEDATFSSGHTVAIDGKVACSGSVMSLRLSDGVIQGLTDYCFYCMFEDCAGLTTAPELPETALAYGCYSNMFQGCTSLTAAPELPATTLADNCYYGMFYGCESLTTAPELPATTLAASCYEFMFSSCNSLTVAPELPATTLAPYCYGSMFDSCKSLTASPELPATTLADSCYYGMFYGCESLSELPELPATTLTDSCYYYMFGGCPKIYISAEAGTIGDITYSAEYRIPSSGTADSADYATYYMFYGTGGQFKGTPDINTTYYIPAPAAEMPEVIKDCTYQYSDQNTYANVPFMPADAQDFSSLTEGAIGLAVMTGMIQLIDTKEYSYKFYDKTGTELAATIRKEQSVPGSGVGLSDDVTCYSKYFNITLPEEGLYIVATAPATYTVTWKNGDTVLETDENVKEGTMPEYNGETPVKGEDGDYIYTFKGWSPEVSAVTSDVTYTAVFDSFKKYVVIIKTPKGSSYNLTVTNNTTIAQIKADLADELGIPAAQQRLIFAGEELEDTKTLVDYNIQKEATIHDVPKSYTVTWLNDDGTTIDTTTVYYGDMPEYNGETPVKAADENNFYAFKGWTPELATVTSDATYTAVFDEYPKSGSFDGLNWSIDDEGTLTFSGSGAIPEDAFKSNPFIKKVIINSSVTGVGANAFADCANLADLTFDSKSPMDFAGGYTYLTDKTTVNVPKDSTYQYTVKVSTLATEEEAYKQVLPTLQAEFKELVAMGFGHDEALAQVLEEYADWVEDQTGEYPIAYEFEFVLEDENRTGNLTDGQKCETVFGNANIHVIVPTYTVTWKNGDTILETDENVAEGTVPEYNGTTPVKDEDETYTYTFAGWSPEVTAVTGDVEYTATFTAENKAVKNVIALIKALPEENEVTLDNEEQIAAARAAYNLLSYDEKDLVSGDVYDRLCGAETALNPLKYDAVNQYKVGQIDSFYIAMDQKIGSYDEQELMNALNDAISAIENVNYDSDKSLAENKAAVDAAIQAQTEVMNNKMTEVCNAYKAQKIAEVQGLAQDGDPDPVYMQIQIIEDRINGETFEDKSVSQFKRDIDRCVEQAQEQISSARVEAFGNYKNDKAYNVQSLAQAGDSAAVIQILDNAVQAIDAVSYDTSKTYVENKAAVDAAVDITQLEQQVIAQRNADEKAAADQAAADPVIDKINALPSPVTLDDKPVVEAARAAYNALTEDQKDLVTVETYEQLMYAEKAIADLEAAKSVTDQINALPAEITLDDKAAVQAARQAYDDLSFYQTSLIAPEILEKLTAAEKVIADREAAKSVTDQINALPSPVTLDDKAAVEAARQAYNDLTDDQKTYVTPETLENLAAAEAAVADLEAAKAVTDQINALPADITLNDKAAVEAARQAYTDLTDDQQALVSTETIDKLIAAEIAISDLEAAQAVEDKINALPSVVLLNNKAEVVAARQAYDDLTDDQKNLVTDETLNKLIAAETVIADREAAKAVDDMVNALPETITLEDKAAVEAADAALENLTIAQAEYVVLSTYGKLADAKKAIADLEAAKAVTDQINALPADITLDDKAAVEAARQAYDDLSTGQKAYVTTETLNKLAAAEKIIADREGAKAVEDMINALPADITLNDKAAVNAANEARLNLPPEQADYLTFAAIGKLFKAMEKIEDLEAAKAVTDQINALPPATDIAVADKEKVESARAAYDALTPNQQALVSNEALAKLAEVEEDLNNSLAAYEVEQMIRALPENITIADKEAVQAARDAYNALTPDQDDIFTHSLLDKLAAAEKSIADQEAAKAVTDQINALPATVTVDNKEQIEAARQAYTDLTDDQKALIDEDTYKKLTDAEEALAAIFADCVIGDVNQDGVVDILDAVIVQKYTVDKCTLTAIQEYVADVNNDGFVDILDATAIQKYAVDRITEFEKKA